MSDYFTRSVGAMQFKICPELADLSKLRGVAGFTDLTGHRYGSFEVVGLLHREGSGYRSAAPWVVKCDCGEFTTQKARAVKNSNPMAMCHRCKYDQILDRMVKRGVKP